MQKFIKTISSLRLTVILLGLSVILVFIGTVAQADEGLYQAQERYFKHWFIPYFSFFGHRVPVPYPGGYLLGTTLLVNLLAAHFTRFKWSWKKSGIFLTHVGIIVLLVGQLATDLLSRETQMRFSEGEKKFYSESPMDYELAIVSDVDSNTEQAVVIPFSLIKKGEEIKHDKLPFVLKVKERWVNSDADFRAPMNTNLPPPLTTNGVATRFDIKETSLTKKMDQKNVPTVIAEIVDGSRSYGDWVLSGWAGDSTLIDGMHFSYAQNFGASLAAAISKSLSTPQVVDVDGKSYTLSLRPSRAYQPYSLTLLKTTHEVYTGTDKPKDFRSRVLIENPETKESRETEIYMNKPLRYAGLTFYQFQMGRDELDRSRGSSTLQVVRNPGWLTPYFGCLLVGLGLVVQFMIHLVGFISKRRTA